MIVLQTIAEPATAADGGTAVRRDAVVPSEAGGRAAPAAELSRAASQTHLTPSVKTATFYRKQAATQEVSSCPPGSHSYLQK